MDELQSDVQKKSTGGLRSLILEHMRRMEGLFALKEPQGEFHPLLEGDRQGDKYAGTELIQRSSVSGETQWLPAAQEKPAQRLRG